MNTNTLARKRLVSVALAALTALAVQPGAQAQTWNWVTLSNPNWEIMVTDYGYSDYLLDRTPGFDGREYLSGEWAAAVGYQRGETRVSPTWLETDFSFPNFRTNSNFGVVQAVTPPASDGSGLPQTTSVVANADLRVTQNFVLLDTVTGVAMGTAANSLGGAGSSLLSNRYVLQQTYTFTNQSDQRLDGVNFFQFLHGLESTEGVYDGRAYTGAMADYRYDVTLNGVSSNGVSTLRDYIGFHSRVAPTAVELGHFGIIGVDNHGEGKPSVGTHLSVEADALNGNDSFNLSWVGGAQRFDLGSLAPGQSATFDVLLSIRTGWVFDGSTDSGSVGGSLNQPGQIDFLFGGSHDAGEFFVEFGSEDAQSIRDMVAAGEIGALTFATPGEELQLFEVEYSGSFEGGLTLTFYFDPLQVSGVELGQLHVFHWTGEVWEDLGGTLDPQAHTLTVVTNSLSPFAIGAAVPEPGTWLMALAGLSALALRRRNRRSPAS